MTMKNFNEFLSEGGEQLNEATDPFSTIEDDFPAVMEDQHGGKWNLFGEALSGPSQGKKLAQAKSYIAYWFAWAAFYPQTELTID